MGNNHNTIELIASIIMFVFSGIITLYLMNLLSEIRSAEVVIDTFDDMEKSVIGMGVFLLYVLDGLSLLLGFILYYWSRRHKEIAQVT